jgi:phosphotriesterase-related protein
MAAKGLLGNVMISQDAGYYRVGEPGGGKFNPYETIYTQFVPKLKPAQVRQLLVENPVKAFNG